MFFIHSSNLSTTTGPGAIDRCDRFQIGRPEPVHAPIECSFCTPPVWSHVVIHTVHEICDLVGNETSSPEWYRSAYLDAGEISHHRAAHTFMLARLMHLIILFCRELCPPAVATATTVPKYWPRKCLNKSKSTYIYVGLMPFDTMTKFESGRGGTLCCARNDSLTAIFIVYPYG